MTIATPRTACPPEDLVVRFCDWTCTDTERAEIEAHVDECDDCRRLLAELAGSLSLPTSIAEARTTEAHASRGPRGPVLARATIVGRLVVLDVLGAGGMGVVYAAYDPELDRKVAIKFLHAQESGADARARILREAQAMARLQHENLIAVYDVGTFRDSVFIAMELSEGTTLEAWLRERPRTWREIVDAFVSAGRGLVAAHEGGILHLDFKPGNVLIRRDGQIKVTDFGLARATPRGGPTEDTGPTQLAGTPRYMAPEQRAGGPVDERTDQYAFCVALYEALYGEHPRARGPARPMPAARGRSPAGLRGVVTRGLHDDPARRHASLRELLQRLRHVPERRRMAWVATLGVTAVAAAALAFTMTDQPDLCRRPVEKFASIWGPTTQQELRAAFLRTGVPYAGDAWKQVSADLDQYRDRWLDMHKETCKATHVSGEQSAELLDLRMQCLDARLDELVQLVRVLAAPDAGVVEQAARATAALGQLAECADTAALRAPVPAPRGLQGRQRVAEIRALLAKAKALRGIARYNEGLDVADTAVQRARELDHRPVLAEALYWQGSLRAQAGDYAGAEAAFVEGSREALAGHHLQFTARTLVELVGVLGSVQSHHERAAEWSAWARAAIAGSGGDPPLMARLLRFEGSVLVGQGQLEPGLVRLQEALAAHQRLDSASSQDLAALHTNLGRALDRMGKFDDALAHHQRALEIKRRDLGPLHPATLGSQFNIASVLTGKGDYDAARSLLLDVLAGFERTLGPRHATTGKAHDLLATLSVFQGRYAEALTWSWRAQEIDELAYGRDSVEVAMTMEGRAVVLSQMGRLEDARALQSRVLAILEQRLGPDHPDVARSLLNLGIVYKDLGDHEKARDYHRRSVDVLERIPGLSPPELAGHLGLYADVLILSGMHAQALQALERAIELNGQVLEADHPDTAMLFASKADVLLAMNRCQDAHELLVRAHDIELKRLGDQHSRLAPRLTKIGHALLCLGRPAEAIEALERAITILTAMPLESCELGDAQFTLARALGRLGERPERARELAAAAAEIYKASGGKCEALADAGKWSVRGG
ncbi:serine/threonine-protein kinase [Nannocystis radixulma]|uniref:Serine/threonine-protein kinase n=1 Tax=Nannocystis radixulma TaxID=2995305 RepID=A0ABT5BF91_9BACT|nr:serine/threonine-protein kinase [Nannocystis radixulma]MDC0672280.1 serine/threonine-protein kinase [Nannocystis radixulma]